MESASLPFIGNTAVPFPRLGSRRYGNRFPKYIPCEAAEPMVKGDSRKYAIASAYILAKVTRDRLMHHEHDVMFPAYGLKWQKGYPITKHMSKVKEIGASPMLYNIM